MLFVLFFSCATAHKGGYEVVATPYGARVMMDGETVSRAVRDGMPVSSRVEGASGRSSSFTAGYPMAQPVPYVSSQLAVDAQAALIARAQWQAAHGSVPGAKAPAVYAPSGGSAGVDLEAACPTDRAPASQAERDACQEMNISGLFDRVGVVKGVK